MRNRNFIFVVITLLVSFGFLGFLISSRGPIVSRTDDIVTSLAKDLGLNVDQFTKDYKGDDVKKIVESQRTDALNRLGGNASTPSVFVNSKLVNLGTYNDLQTQLDKMVADPATKFPINVEIFVDYNCPHCREFDVFLEPLKKDAKYKGKVDFVEKNLPFLRDNSLQLAYAAEAARKQNKFDEYSPKLFRRAQGVE